MFCNPPYGKELIKWVKKCHDEAIKGAFVVMLISLVVFKNGNKKLSEIGE